MFTGIVQSKARIASITDTPAGKRLIVDARDWRPAQGYTPAPGDSICISGVCLTVLDAPGAAATELQFDVIAETLAKTTLGDLQPGDEVNLEPAVTPNQPLGGHFMQGHVDGVGTITAVRREGEDHRITIEPPAELLDTIVPKGSIAVDGVSLTIAAVHPDCFEIALIPTTLDVTTLGSAAPGGRVNLEADILAKTVVHYLRRTRRTDPGITTETLKNAGFLE